MSRAKQRVSTLLDIDRDRRWHALDIARLLRLRSGRLYVVLAALEKDGLVVSGWDDDATPPRRRWYRAANAEDNRTTIIAEMAGTDFGTARRLGF